MLWHLNRVRVLVSPSLIKGKVEKTYMCLKAVTILFFCFSGCNRNNITILLFYLWDYSIFPSSKPSQRPLPLGSLKEKGDRTNVLSVLSLILRARISQEVRPQDRKASCKNKSKQNQTNEFVSSYDFFLSPLVHLRSALAGLKSLCQARNGGICL